MHATPQQWQSTTSNKRQSVEQSSEGRPKIRKPYTITKQRENWTEAEHGLFLSGLELYDRDWKRIAAHVQTKTVIQIRSHAQKYFLKLQKQGSTQGIPPPRPKRKPHNTPQPSRESKRPKTTSTDNNSAATSLHNAALRAEAEANRILSSEISTPLNSTISNPVPATTSLGALITPHPSHDEPTEGPCLPPVLLETPPIAPTPQIVCPTPRASPPEPTDQDVYPDVKKVYGFMTALYAADANACSAALQGMTSVDRRAISLILHDFALHMSKHFGTQVEPAGASLLDPSDLPSTLTSEFPNGSPLLPNSKNLTAHLQRINAVVPEESPTMLRLGIFTSSHHPPPPAEAHSNHTPPVLQPQAVSNPGRVRSGLANPVNCDPDSEDEEEESDIEPGVEDGS